MVNYRILSCHPSRGWGALREPEFTTAWLRPPVISLTRSGVQRARVAGGLWVAPLAFAPPWQRMSMLVAAITILLREAATPACRKVATVEPIAARWTILRPTPPSVVLPGPRGLSQAAAPEVVGPQVAQVVELRRIRAPS